MDKYTEKLDTNNNLIPAQIEYELKVWLLFGAC